MKSEKRIKQKEIENKFTIFLMLLSTAAIVILSGLSKEYRYLLLCLFPILFGVITLVFIRTDAFMHNLILYSWRRVFGFLGFVAGALLGGVIFMWVETLDRFTFFLLFCAIAPIIWVAYIYLIEAEWDEPNK